MNIEKINSRLNYKFNDQELILMALTHSSYCNEHDLSYSQCNERMEFLGDAILDAVISEDLFRTLGEKEEGELSKLRASIVCEQSLYRKAKELGLDNHLRMGRGEQHALARKRKSLIADSMEAVIGAIFLDGGWDSAKKFVLDNFIDITADAIQGKLKNDYKTMLQERLQVGGDVKITYKVEKDEGPDHDKTFYVVLLCNGNEIGRGVGNSKKQAEQNAARVALESLGKNGEVEQPK